MPQLPTPLRAAIGLVATALDEARTLPDKAIELPMLAVSTALQMSLRAQQRYAHLAARGDELINRREPTDDPPAWATFDAPVTTANVGLREVRADEDTVFEPRTATRSTANDTTTSNKQAPTGSTPRKSTATGSTPRKSTATGSTPRKSTATGSTPRKSTATGSTPRKSTATGSTPRKSTAAEPTIRKTVRSPRNTKPSAFDTIGDE